MSISPVPPRPDVPKAVPPPPRPRIQPRVVVPPRLAAADLDALDGPFAVRLQTHGDSTCGVVRCGGQHLGDVTLLPGQRFLLARPGLAPVEITRDGSRRLLSLLVNAMWGSRWNRP